MKNGSLLMDLRVGQSLSIDGGRIIVSLEHKSGQIAKLRFVADDSVTIERPGAKSAKHHRGSGAKQALLGVNFR